MSVGSFFHSIETGVVSAEQHVVHWVEGEAPKVEKLILQGESWIGANATAKAFFQPMLDAFTTEIKNLGAAALATLGSGASLESLVKEVETKIPALITSLGTVFISQAKAADPTSHTSVVLGLLNFAYALVSPKLGTILGALLPKA